MKPKLSFVAMKQFFEQNAETNDAIFMGRDFVEPEKVPAV